MRIIILHIISIWISFYVISCKKKTPLPIWTNKLDTIVFQNLEFLIESEETLEKAILYTPFKSIVLNINIKSDYLSSLRLPENSGIIEGNSFLFLKTKNNETVFEFELVNEKPGKGKKKDYRSPKTVNSDSVLEHQQMVHWIDQNRMLVPNDKNSYFIEKMIGVSSKSGQYEGIPSEPLTNYYSQPGTASKLIINIIEKNDSKIIKVGPIVDRLNNRVADGTLINIRYKKEGFEYMIPVVSRDGMAITTIENSIGVTEIFAETAKQTTGKN